MRYKLFGLIIAFTACRAASAQSISYSPLYTDATFSRTIDISKPVGVIDGTAGTTASGGASYTIPIQCPPGTNGVVPKLSVVYHSQSGNGLLGQGCLSKRGEISEGQDVTK